MKYFNLNLFKSAQKYLIGSCIALITLTSLAEIPPIDTGLELGTQIPALMVLDQFGDKQQLSNMMGEKGAIIVLFRSADWCPFCKRHLLELNEEVLKFKQKGYGVAAISYDSPKILREFAQKKKLKFSLLSDQDVESFKALNVVNKENEPGDRHYGIPYPGVIVVNKQGKIIHKYFFEGYKKRVKFKQLLTKLI
jgi:peroxiredoxin